VRQMNIESCYIVELREVIRPTIPSLIKLMEDGNYDVRLSVTSTFVILAKEGESSIGAIINKFIWIHRGAS
jgi:hypothetical protein